jgi:uncharacterized circularly permuted ATP-grasp superfamily protein/uncharacterized alpha-E superfamily protein
MNQIAETPAASPETFAAGAAPAAAGAYDELRGQDGRLRPPWPALLGALAGVGRRELAVRAADARRLLREHGVTCPVAHGAHGEERPWELDSLPFLITAEEWRLLEAGLVQRANLLNLVLRDLYGVQRLVRDGFLPAPLIFANPGYLRACQGVRPPMDRHLHSYAADLARSPDGTWWVLADRTQVPAGIGFALENRTVLSRVLPEAVAAVQPRVLTGTLRRRRLALQGLAPWNSDNPAIVLLSPGPRNEAYYEHAYLARLQGYTLVESGDLTVRYRQVFLKTLEGLRPVDVILRRIADTWCDPLELRADSLIGVPGLVEATRAGRVAVANTLGSGLLEGPAFLAFLPALCRHLLGEELRLPSVATWWCGQSYERNFVREHFDELVIAPAFVLADSPRRGGETDAATRARLLEHLDHSPHEWVGQEEVILSQAPVMTEPGWTTRPTVLRAFAVFDGEQYRVMPGGLLRLLDRPRLGTARLSLAGPTKDVWVLPDGDNRPTVAAVRARPMFRPPSTSDLPSRTADALFWLGRYAERLEQLVRAARGVLQQLADDRGAGSERRLRALAAFTQELGILRVPADAPKVSEALLHDVFEVLHDKARKPGVPELLARIHQVAFAARDRLSADTWRLLNRLQPDAQHAPGRVPLFRASNVLTRLVLDLTGFSGLENENMTRGHGWRFLGLGRRTERGIGVAQLLEAALVAVTPPDPLLEPLLEIADSAMTYRRQYFIEPLLPGVLRLLLLERSNPRSLAFQLAAIGDHVAALPPGANPEGLQQIREHVARLPAPLRQLWPDEEPTPTTVGPEPVIAGLREVVLDLSAFSNLLTRVFFSHVKPQVE